MRGSRRLRLVALWPALAALLVVAVALSLLLPALFEHSAGDRLADELQLVERALEAVGGFDDAHAVQARATRLAAGTHLRVTVVRLDGGVVADSDRTWEEVAQMDDHSGRPEVRDALAGGVGLSKRRSETTGRRYVFAARLFTPTGGRPHVLRVAQPLDGLPRMRTRVLGTLALAVLAALVCLGAVSAWLDRRLLEPLARLIDGAAALAAGRYDRRLPVPGQPDLAALAQSINRMTERVEDQIAVVKEERDHLHAILASMSEGVLVVDGDGRAVLANPAFRALFGAPAEIAGRLPLELTRQPELAAVVGRVLAEGEARHEELLLDAGAEPRTVALAGSVLRSAGGRGAGRGVSERPGGVVVARDTTEVTRVAQMRRDFVANVSHELKTPLSAIRGFAETLRDGALGEADTAVRFTERILEQCRRLQEMLDDLLILSRLESVEIPLESRPVDLVRLVEKAVETICAFADEHSVELSAELPEGGLPRVTGDPWALERLLLNLLENGVKYNRDDGEVRVRLAGGVDEAGGAEVVIEVSDTGIGIPAEALPRIFERFYRVDKGRARDEGGTGLGLAIVKHVAQAHGGRVEVTSRARHGSTFRLHLPATAA